jgi:hypothetical protein
VPFTAPKAGCSASVLRVASQQGATPAHRCRLRPRECSRGAWQLVDHPARLFVCALCRAQVLLCSRCDRGQRYCTRACSRAARQAAQREAARRYQASRAGRIAHAARSLRWRQRRRECELAAGVAAVVDAVATEFVTHQGCPLPAADAPLAAPEPAEECASGVGEASAAPIPAQCRRCATALAPWVRQGFLRHGMRRWPARVIDPSP